MVGFDYNSTPEMTDFSPPAIGRHDVSIKMSEHAISKSSGKDMQVITFLVDNGPDMGKEVQEYYPFGLESNFGERKLKSTAVAASSAEYPEGFVFEPKATWDEFAAQFVRTPPLRLCLKIDHKYSIETERGWKDNISKAEYDAHDGRKSVKADIKGFYPPTNPAVLTLGGTSAPQAQPTMVGPSFGGDGAANGTPLPAGSAEADDGLPF